MGEVGRPTLLGPPQETGKHCCLLDLAAVWRRDMEKRAGAGLTDTHWVS